MIERCHDTLNLIPVSRRGPDYHTRTVRVTLHFDKSGNLSDFSPYYIGDKEEQLVWTALQRLIRPSLFDCCVPSFRGAGR